MKIFRITAIISAFLLLSGFTECYKPVTNSGLPANIRTIAVPGFQFEAKGLRYKVESRFTDAVSREIIRRGNGLKVQGSRAGADAVLEGTIRDFSFSGVLLDSEGRARVYEVTIVAAAVFMVSALLISMPALSGNVSVLQSNADAPVEAPAEVPAVTNTNTVDANASANTPVSNTDGALIETPATQTVEEANSSNTSPANK